MSDVIGTIGILTSEPARWSRFWVHILRLQKPGSVKVDYQVSTNVAQARNDIMRAAAGEWLWFIDDDHTFPPDILMRLLDREVDIVQPVVLSRQPPFGPVAMAEPTEVPDKPGVIGHRKQVLEPFDSGLRAAHVVGCGGMLVRRRVWEALPEPWFRTGELEPDVLSEDIGFCRRARAAGFEIWEDLDTPMGHIAAMELWPCRKEDGSWSTEVRCGKFSFHLPPARRESGLIYLGG